MHNINGIYQVYTWYILSMISYDWYMIVFMFVFRISWAASQSPRPRPNGYSGRRSSGHRRPGRLDAFYFKSCYRFTDWRVAVRPKDATVSFLHRHSCASNQWPVWTRYSLSVWRSPVSALPCISGFSLHGRGWGFKRDNVSNHAVHDVLEGTIVWSGCCISISKHRGSSGEGRCRTQEASPQGRNTARSLQSWGMLYQK